MKTYLIMSGKGGSGKSTSAINIAYGLALKGKKVGISDSDITGSNIAFLLGMKRTDIELLDYSYIKPFVWEKHGVKLEIMGMSFMTSSHTQPMLMKGDKKRIFVREFIDKVSWGSQIGSLDYMIVDLPPGSGSEAVSIIETLKKIDGVVITTTPSRVCLIDVAKTIKLCKKLELKIVGLVVSMSHFRCDCGKKSYIFGDNGGISKFADRYNVNIISQIPIVPLANTEPLFLSDFYTDAVKKISGRW